MCVVYTIHEFVGASKKNTQTAAGDNSTPDMFWKAIARGIWESSEEDQQKCSISKSE